MSAFIIEHYVPLHHALSHGVYFKNIRWCRLTNVNIQVPTLTLRLLFHDKVISSFLKIFIIAFATPIQGTIHITFHITNINIRILSSSTFYLVVVAILKGSNWECTSITLNNPDNDSKNTER